MNTQSPEALLKQIDEQLNILVLVQGTLADGSAHYAYASIPPSRYDAFKQAEAAGNYDLAKFGQILAHGAGAQPSADVSKRMEEEFGANHKLEEDMQALLKSLQKQA